MDCRSVRAGLLQLGEQLMDILFAKAMLARAALGELKTQTRIDVAPGKHLLETGACDHRGIELEALHAQVGRRRFHILHRQRDMRNAWPAIVDQARHLRFRFRSLAQHELDVVVRNSAEIMPVRAPATTRRWIRLKPSMP